MPLDYELDELQLEQLTDAPVQLRRKKGLRFMMVGNKQTRRLPWIVLERESRMEASVAQAMRAIRKSRRFNFAHTAKGEAVVIDRVLYLLCEEQKIPSFETRLRAAWAIDLGKHGDAALKKLSVVFKRTVVVEGDTKVKAFHDKVEQGTLEAPEDLEPLSTLDTKTLAALFGDDGQEDAEELVASSQTLSELADQVKLANPEQATARAQKLFDGLLTDLFDGPAHEKLDQMDSFLAPFLRLATRDVSVGSKPLETGQVLSVEVNVLTLATEFTTHLRFLTQWESLMAQLEVYDEELNDIEQSLDDNATQADLDDYEGLLEVRNAVFARTTTLSESVLAFVARIEKNLTALQTHHSTK